MASKKAFNMERASRPAPLREKQIEQYLCAQVKKRLGGKARKYNSPGRAAEPDRLITWKAGKIGLVFFCECKRPGEKPTAAQEKALQDLRDDGQMVGWVDTKGAVDRLLDGLELL